MKGNNKCIWVLVNCNSKGEALEIGNGLLNKRLIACFDIFNREISRYFWPPKSNHIEEVGGCLLVTSGFEKSYDKIIIEIEKLHSDKVPFIGFIEINGLTNDYFNWMKEEIKK